MKYFLYFLLLVSTHSFAKDPSITVLTEALGDENTNRVTIYYSMCRREYVRDTLKCYFRTDGQIGIPADGETVFPLAVSTDTFIVSEIEMNSKPIYGPFKIDYKNRCFVKDGQKLKFLYRDDGSVVCNIPRPK